MRNKIYVICGNNHEFLDFARRKVSEGWPTDTSLSLSDFVYVNGEDRLRGIRNPHGYFYGRWRERKDIQLILRTLSVAYTTEPPSDNLLKIFQGELK